MILNDVFTAFVISFLIQVVFFAIAAYFRTDKVTDFSYGLSFVVIVWFLAIKNSSFSSIQVVLVLLISLWGIRLATYLVVRILRNGKDKRFDGVREDFYKFAKFWIFQALVVWMILLPTVIVLATPSYKFGLTQIIGLTVWLIGFGIEAISDQQKFAFKIKKPDEFITTGLWRYSRHPNYFGEALLWWGIFIIATPYLSGFSYLSIIGPICIMSLLLFVSGIPSLEKSYDKKYGLQNKYRKYKKSTSIFVPLPPYK